MHDSIANKDLRGGKVEISAIRTGSDSFTAAIHMSKNKGLKPSAQTKLCEKYWADAALLSGDQLNWHPSADVCAHMLVLDHTWKVPDACA